MKRPIAALSAAALLIGSGIVYAGLKDHHIHAFPPPAFSYDTMVIPIATGSTRTAAIKFTTTRDMIVTGIRASVREMTGTITAFTVQVKRGSLVSMNTALDMYGAGLADVGTFREGVLNRPSTWWPAGSSITVDTTTTGTNTPLGKDITLQIDYRTPVGVEH
jgi:hypothetical protein